MTGAIRIVRAPADAGHAPSMALLGFLLESAGLYEEAVEQYRKAAERGDIDGVFGLASAYASGQGVVRDHAEARRLFERAARAGHRQSVEVLAEVAMRGGLGVAPGARVEGNSLELVRQAADGNHLASLDFLARGYRDGSVGTVDVALAAQYEQRAERLRYPNGRPKARRR